MKTLTKVTGEVLTLVFNTEGALSSARLGGQDVTPSLRYVRKEDYRELLRTFGFKEEWPVEQRRLFTAIDGQLREAKLKVFNVIQEGPGLYAVLLCASTDPAFVHKKTKVIARFDASTRTFTETVRSFDGCTLPTHLSR